MRSFLIPAGLLILAGVVLAWPTEPVPPVGQTLTPGTLGKVSVRSPRTPSVATGKVDARGGPVRVACSVCHTTRPPNAETRAPLRDFHQGLSFDHGALGCLACHDSRDYDRLHLADGSPLPYARTLDLCSQCHGGMRRAYDHGAHGGMQGHWDLKRGDRSRNHCIDCHDPHVPAFPRLRPVFAPRDGEKHE
jgi:hypothetical protein